MRLRSLLCIAVLATICTACNSSQETAAPAADAEQPTAAVEQPTTARVEAEELGSTPEAAGSGEAEIPPGYELFEGSAFSVALPAGWETLDPEFVDFEDFEAFLAQADVPDPADREAMLHRMRLAQENGFDLWAFDRSTMPGGFVDNLNVLCAPQPTLGGLDVLESQVSTEMQQVGATDLAFSRTDLGGQGAVRVTYALPAFGTTGVGFYLLGDAQFCALTVTVGGADQAHAAQVADPIGATFRLGA